MSLQTKPASPGNECIGTCCRVVPVCGASREEKAGTGKADPGDVSKKKLRCRKVDGQVGMLLPEQSMRGTFKRSEC